MQDILTDIFHSCALWAYVDAMAEGKEQDSEYVKGLAYQYYEKAIKEEKCKLNK